MGCAPDRAAAPATTVPATAAPASSAGAPAPDPLPPARPHTEGSTAPPRAPELALVRTPHRDALAAAAEPEVHETRVGDGIETTLVLRVGDTSITLARAVWDLDRCEDFSSHYAVVDAAHALVDARINCRFGEDFWTTDVAAELVVVDVAAGTARALWSGTETYTGAMGECTTADGAIAYALEPGIVWQGRTSWATWDPHDPAQPLVPQADCVAPATPDSRTAMAILRPGP